jgi:nucleoredoxin
MKLHLLLFSVFLAASALGAPITVKEIDFLVRQRTPDAEIVKEVQQRRMLIPIDAAGEATLKGSGASDALIAQLKAPSMTLPQAEAQAEARRLVAREMKVAAEARQDAKAYANLQQQKAKAAADIEKQGTVARMLAGRLVRLDGDALKPAAPDLSRVRVFAFYYAAGWSPQCRKVTPVIMEVYKRMQQKHPGEFEIIYLPGDRDEYNMQEHMRTMRMPWPALRYGAGDAEVGKYQSTSFPGLMAVAATGDKLDVRTRPAAYSNPDEMVAEVEELLQRVK